MHAAFLAIVLFAPQRTYDETIRYVFIGGTPGETQEIEWPSFPSASARGREGGEPGPRRAGAPRGRAEPTVAPVAPAAGLEPGATPDTAAGVIAAAGEGGEGGDAAADSVPGAPSPRLGNGALWVRPLRFADLPQDVRESMLRDPATTARLQALFDSIRNEAGADQALPAWAIDVPGVGRAGLDSGWIMLGPIRIPAAVLALIPFPQGNIEEAERAERLADMRADLLRAAQRAATVDEFKRAVRELRERKQRERDMERARRGRDTIIP